MSSQVANRNHFSMVFLRCQDPVIHSAHIIPLYREVARCEPLADEPIATIDRNSSVQLRYRRYPSGSH